MDIYEKKKNIYTQLGQDGIIEFIFDTLNINKGTFCEFGAWDGIHLSNCRHLSEKGWSGIFIEADSERYQTLCDNYKDQTSITCINSFVESSGINSLDTIIENNVPNTSLDFASIDIDGFDIKILESIKKYLPKVICIEGGQMYNPYFNKKVSDNIASNNLQQSLSVIKGIAEKKGYFILCSYQDTFLVKEEFKKSFSEYIESDLMKIYVNGLKQCIHRIPYINRQLNSVMFDNNIATYILNKTNFKKYGYGNRKKWLEEKKDQAISLLDNLPVEFKNPNYKVSIIRKIKMKYFS